MKDHEETGPSGVMVATQDFGPPEPGGHRVGTVSEAVNSRAAPEDEALSQGSSPCSLEATPESTGSCANAEGAGWHQVDPPPQYGMSYRCLLRQNQVLLTALEELQLRCATLKKENSLMRKSCFPETQEKVRHLKRKNAELAVIAKRLEERARKLHEANLKVVNAPVAMKGSCAGLCKKTLARQRAADLRDQASALLAKDKQINTLQQECQELQAKIVAGKEVSSHHPLLDFHHLLRESQKEVLRLQRQIALKSIKAPTGNPRSQVLGLSPAGASRTPTCPNGFSSAQVSRGRRGTYPATEATNKTGPRVLPLAQARDGNGNSLPLKKGIVPATPEIKQQIQQLESELRKKRKQCENLEHEVRKRHKRYAELEIQFQEVRSNNARLSEENALLLGQVEWIEKVESQNADLRLQVAVVSEERDSALQKTRELESRLESLRQALKHMRDVAERRQHLEHEHEAALQALQKKQEEVRHLQQAQAEARKAHEGAVQLLEESLDCMQARVQELEDQCQSHTEQFQFLSRELTHFPLHAAKAGLPPSPPQVTPEVAFATRCSSPPQLLEDHKEKDPELLPVTPWCNPKVQDEGAAPRPPGLMVPAMARSPEGHISPMSSKRAIKKPESQSSSSRSESIPTASPKSCPTPEVDTASEMEDLDIDSVSLVPETETLSPVKLRVFLARYSYNPFAGPNENPEAELPLTAGEYIYVYGDMDEDGFLEGELMDGRRGLVPSNFVERVSDDDLVTFFPGDLHDLSHSSPLEHGFLSTSLSSGERSDYSATEHSLSTAPSRLEGDPGAPSAVVPYPRKVALIKQFGSGLLVGWEPPLVPAGGPEIQSYNVLVDTEMRQNVKAGGQTKAVIEKLDLNGQAYRISVQSVAEKGFSDSLRCTFLVGKDFAMAPSRLAAWSVTATSTKISWAPSNSNFPHTVFLDGEEQGIAKAGIYWFAFHDLKPGTSYVARVEAQPQGGFWESVREQPLGAEIRFATTLAGSPDAPLDVRVEPGPMSGILVISWLPVTIDAEGSSNGVRVTGYAVYTDGQKLMEVTSPTAGSVLVEVSQLQVLQACREVSVRTVSLYGESLDSVPAQIPLTLLESTGASSSSEHLSPSSWFSCGNGRSSPALATSQGSGMDQSPATGLPVNIFADQGCTDGKKGEDVLRPETSPKRLTSPSTPAKSDPPLKEEPDSHGPLAGNPAKLTEVAREGPRGNRQEGTENPDSSARAPELCPNRPTEQDPEASSPGRKADNVRSLQGRKTPPPGQISTPGEDDAGDWGQHETLDLDPGNGSPVKAKVMTKELSWEEPPGLALPRVRREGEKRSDAGNRPLNLLSDHSRGSDLSDIMEEDEEEEDGEKRCNHQTNCPGRENREKQDPGDPDSDDEILERLLEMQPANPGYKALFSIPEVAEEEEEEEASEHRPVNPVSTTPGTKPGVPCFDGHPENMDVSPPLSPWKAQPNSPQNRPERIWLKRGPLPQAGDGKPPACPRHWEWGCLGKPAKADMKRRQPRHCKERSRWAKMQSSDRNPEQRSSMLGPARPAGGGLYRAQSLTENLDVISSLGTEEISTLSGWQRTRPHREMVAKPLRALSRCLSPESLEIDVEYDSEEDLTLTSTAASQDSSDGQAEGSPTDPEEGWSDSSGCSGSVRSGRAKELKRCSSWEEESLEWSGSPVRSPSWKQRVALDERSRSLERSPSLCRARPERPWRESPRGPSLPLWAATGNSPPESLSLATRRAPTRRGRRLRRKIREAAVSGAWRSPSPETMTDEGDSARLFVALFDYDPVSMSPNPDAAQEELPFQEGQILKVYGPKDADGFYQGEGGGRIGYIPCNMVSEIQVDKDTIRPQLLDEDHLPTDQLVDRLANCPFSGPTQHATARPPKPRRSKKVGQKKKDEEIPDFDVCEVRDPSSEEETPRAMVAIFDYNPKENSPNPDAEAELKFCAGDLVTVLGSMDDDGFYYAEIHGQKGLVPSNFLEAMASDAPVEPSLGRQWDPLDHQGHPRKRFAGPLKANLEPNQKENPSGNGAESLGKHWNPKEPKR